LEIERENALIKEETDIRKEYDKKPFLPFRYETILFKNPDNKVDFI
jgi:hypothetical protein